MVDYTLAQRCAMLREKCRDCGYADECDHNGCDIILDAIEAKMDAEADYAYEDNV